MASCIEWDGHLDKDGYGQVYSAGRKWQAHRLAWTKVNGAIPKGKLVLHSCDNPACVNIDHLRIGTHADNVRDAVVRKRHKESKKTNCPLGHPLKLTSEGIRRCPICRRIKTREYSRRYYYKWLIV